MLAPNKRTLLTILSKNSSYDEAHYWHRMMIPCMNDTQVNGLIKNIRATGYKQYLITKRALELININ